MNLIQTNLLREVAAEVKAHGGPLQFKAHALKNLELRTVLKESHGSPVVDLVFNSVDPGHRNLFASIGKDQATIYDDEHMGDFLGVVVQYVNTPSAHHRGGDITCCAWVQMSGITQHELGDACLAVSGPEGVIQVISVVEARVISLLKGHRGEVVELRGCAGIPGLLLSLGMDGSLRLWDVAVGVCLAEMASDAVTLETRPDGGCFFTGHRGGRICCWDLDLDTGTRATPDPYGDAARLTTESTYSATHIATVPWSAGGLRKGATSTNHRLALRGAPLTPQQLMLPGNLLGDVVDCVRWLPEGRLAAKSADGRLAVWDLKGKEVPKQLLSLRVPGTHPVGGSCQGAAAVIHGGRCRFSVTQDGAFICVGNAAGDIYVYDTSTGARAAHYSTQKMRGPARAATLSEDGRHLLTVHGNGYILRYEYIRKQLCTGAAANGVVKGVNDVTQAADGADAPTDEIAPDGAAASSRECSPEAFTEDDIPAAVGPGTAAVGPAAGAPIKRPCPADGDVSGSCGGGSGSGDEGGGKPAGALVLAGRRIKLRVRFGPRVVVGLVGRPAAGECTASGASALQPVRGEDRDTSPDAEWSGGLEDA